MVEVVMGRPRGKFQLALELGGGGGSGRGGEGARLLGRIAVVDDALGIILMKRGRERSEI